MAVGDVLRIGDDGHQEFAPAGGGTGAIEVQTPSDPAPGAEWIVTVPEGETWRILSVSAAFVASATTANRTPHYLIKDDEGAVLFFGSSGAGHAASTQRRVVAAIGLQCNASAQLLANNLPIPDLVLEEGWTFGSETGLIEADDQWTAIAVMVEKVTL